MALEDFEAYKIVSVLDGNVIDLADWSTANGAIVKTAKDAFNENQMWVAQLEDQGYQFRGKIQQGRTLKVLNEDEGDKVTHRVFESTENQEWILEPAEEEGAFYLKCRGSGKYMENPGAGEQVITTEKKAEEKSQQWRFVLVP